jgi:hypothetical protein
VHVAHEGALLDGVDPERCPVHRRHRGLETAEPRRQDHDADDDGARENVSTALLGGWARNVQVEYSLFGKRLSQPAAANAFTKGRIVPLSRFVYLLL